LNGWNDVELVPALNLEPGTLNGAQRLNGLNDWNGWNAREGKDI